MTRDSGDHGDNLAGPLGFEPRQSAPKALDLPLVDGPTFNLLKLVALASDYGDHQITRSSPSALSSTVLWAKSPWRVPGYLRLPASSLPRLPTPGRQTNRTRQSLTRKATHTSPQSVQAHV